MPAASWEQALVLWPPAPQLLLPVVAKVAYQPPTIIPNFSAKQAFNFATDRGIHAMLFVNTTWLFSFYSEPNGSL